MNYYKTLDKAAKNNIKEEFLKTNNVIYVKARKVAIISLIGVIFSVLCFMFDFMYKTGIFSYILDVLLLVFSLYFGYKMNNIMIGEINKFALKKK